MADELVERVSSTRYYDTSEVIVAKQHKLKTLYLDGEIDQQEFESEMSKTTEKEVAGDIEQVKAEKYEDLQEQFMNDEITEQEMEEEMDDLFASGDEFLDVEQTDDSPDMTGDLFFRLKEIGQIVAALALVSVVLFLFFITKGAALWPMIGISIVALLAYARYRGAI